MARRPVSDCGETRCRDERCPQSTADAKKALSKRHQGTPRGVTPQSPQLTELFSPITSADPNATIRSKFPVKKQGPPGPIKSLQEGPDRSWDAHLQMDLRGLCAPLQTCNGEHYDRHWTCGRRIRQYC